MKRNTGLYRFLDSEGYLKKGPEDIAAGKKIYRRQYLLRYKSDYRQRTIEHTIASKPIEEKLLATAAKEHGMKVPEYIKLAALAYSKKVFLMPRLELIYQVQQTLIYARTQIERVRQEKKGFFAKSKDDRIEELLQSLERTVHSAFKTPTDLETLIREVLQKQPAFAERLKSLLIEYDCKEHRPKE